MRARSARIQMQLRVYKSLSKESIMPERRSNVLLELFPRTIFRWHETIFANDSGSIYVRSIRDSQLEVSSCIVTSQFFYVKFVDTPVSIERSWHYVFRDERRVQWLESVYRTRRIPICLYRNLSVGFFTLYVIVLIEELLVKIITIDDPNSQRTSEYWFLSVLILDKSFKIIELMISIQTSRLLSLARFARSQAWMWPWDISSLQQLLD